MTQIDARTDSAAVTIKMLDGTAVLCQIGGCGKPALYLFSATRPAASHVAYCEVHGGDMAERVRAILPLAKEVRLRPSAASRASRDYWTQIW